MIQHGLSPADIELMTDEERFEFLTIAEILEQRKMRFFLEAVAGMLGAKRG